MEPEQPGPVVVSYGGGVNSTALLVGLAERGQPPDIILFADTGGEWQHTYDYVTMFSEWCNKRLGVPILTIRNQSPHGTLEQECLNNGTLPSLAFGFKGCSVKWKRQPMDRYIREWGPALEAWAGDRRVMRLIGIDAGEAHRGKIPDDKRFVYRFPLIEWDWAREECLEAIERAGLPEPKKSACFFCPATKKREVPPIAIEYPDLFKRAVEMERNAEERGGLKKIKGLGRHWSWQQVAGLDEAGMKGVPDVIHSPCGCYDGETDDARIN